jgi:hypothetical protein
MTAFACAVAFTLVRVTGSFAVSVGSVPTPAFTPAVPAARASPPVGRVERDPVCVTPGPLIGAVVVAVAVPVPVETPFVSGDVTVIGPPVVTVVVGTVASTVVPVVVTVAVVPVTVADVPLVDTEGVPPVVPAPQASLSAVLEPDAARSAFARMHSAAFAAGARSTLVPPVPPDAGTTAVPPLGVVPEAVAQDVLSDAVAEESGALSGTLARAFRRTHAAAFAAGARLTDVPVVSSRAMTGLPTAAADGDPPASAEHVEARSTAVVVPAMPFARRHEAAETAGAAETVVPVRDEVTVVSPDAFAVEGADPHRLASDA